MLNRIADQGVAAGNCALILGSAQGQNAHGATRASGGSGGLCPRPTSRARPLDDTRRSSGSARRRAEPDRGAQRPGCWPATGGPWSRVRPKSPSIAATSWVGRDRQPSGARAPPHHTGR